MPNVDVHVQCNTWYYSVCSVSLWQDGAKLCARILSSEDTVILLAQQMVAMAQYYRFDGWLVNIENPINVRYMYIVAYYSTCISIMYTLLGSADSVCS